MKKIILISALLILTGCQGGPVSVQIEKNESNKISVDSRPIAASLLSEYCFNPAGDIKVGLEKITTTPEAFLNSHDYVTAAINGVYWGADDGEPQGDVYFNGREYASGKGLISGYLTIYKAGKINASDKLSGAKSDYKLIIGTHPLIIVNGEISSQALSSRYNLDNQGASKLSYRSAIGTKDNKNICFAVSTGSITMKQWAELLKNNGYSDAINLDGGPISQLAIRENGEVKVKGGGIMSTRLIIYAYEK